MSLLSRDQLSQAMAPWSWGSRKPSPTAHAAPCPSLPSFLDDCIPLTHRKLLILLLPILLFPHNSFSKQVSDSYLTDEAEGRVSMLTAGPGVSPQPQRPPNYAAYCSLPVMTHLTNPVTIQELVKEQILTCQISIIPSIFQIRTPQLRSQMMPRSHNQESSQKQQPSTASCLPFASMVPTF